MDNENMVRKVEALLRRAAHPETPQAEAEAAQLKADQLMTDYRIERSRVMEFGNDLEKDSLREPIMRTYDTIRFGTENVGGSEFTIASEMSGLRQSVFDFTGCKFKVTWNHEELKAEHNFVGYAEDIYYAEMIWVNLLADITKAMYPGWKSSRSFDENVFLLKNAGYSWPQIMILGLRENAADSRGLLTETNAASKLRTAYSREAKARGLDPKPKMIRDPHWWRKSFSASYVSRIRQRFYEIKDERKQYAGKNLPALIDDESRVEEAFYGFFPDMRPIPEEDLPETEDTVEPKKRIREKKIRYRDADPSAWSAGFYRANSVDLSNRGQFERKEQIE